jgi:hypothetical protein
MSSFRLTKDGFLIARPRVARTGIQLYKGSECGKPDMEVVRVYRPPSEVFDAAAVNSYAYLPVTLEHPNGPVTSRNWRKVAVGETSNVVTRDGDTIRVDVVVRDADAIKLISDGAKTQISLGYTCELVWGAGITPNGETFDARQTAIRCNHLAVVATARGGERLSIDARKELTHAY